VSDWKVSVNTPGAFVYTYPLEGELVAWIHAQEIADQYGEAFIEGGEHGRTFVLRRLLTADYQ
jgi:hypothetical protein